MYREWREISEDGVVKQRAAARLLAAPLTTPFDEVVKRALNRSKNASRGAARYFSGLLMNFNEI